MATVRKREGKNGISWQIDYFDPNGKRVRQSFKKKKDAEAELAKRVALIAEKRYLDVKQEYTTTLEDRYLSKEEIKHLLPGCADHLRPIVECALHAGLRQGEVLGLKWKDIDFKRERLFGDCCSVAAQGHQDNNAVYAPFAKAQKESGQYPDRVDRP